MGQTWRTQIARGCVVYAYPEVTHTHTHTTVRSDQLHHHLYQCIRVSRQLCGPRVCRLAAIYSTVGLIRSTVDNNKCVNAE